MTDILDKIKLDKLLTELQLKSIQESLVQEISEIVGIPKATLVGTRNGDFPSFFQLTDDIMVHEPTAYEVAREDFMAMNPLFVNRGRLTEDGYYQYELVWSGKIEMRPLPIPYMDSKYPRKCFKCNCNLAFRDYLDAQNILLFTEPFCYEPKTRKCRVERYMYNREKLKQMRRWWKSSFIQLYCCDCYDKTKK